MISASDMPGPGAGVTAAEIDAVAPLIAGVTASERAAVFPLMKFFIAEPGLSSAPSLAKAAARRSAIIAER